MSLPVRGLGEGSTHGLLGEEFSIDANGIPLTFATEAGAASADADVGGQGVWTGRFLWASGGVLARFVVEKGADYWAEKRVLELGCGCGLAGLTAAAMGARQTVLTDQVTDGAASNLAANATVAPELAERCSVSKLCWGVEEDYESVAPLPFDVILGSDILQESGDIVGNYKTLADTVGALSGPTTEFWLCNAIANPLKLAEFFGQMKRHGFKSKVVKPPLGFDPIAIVLFFKPPLLEEGGDDTSAKSTASTQSPASGSTSQVRSLTALGMAWAKAAAADMSSRTTPHPSPAKEIATAGQRNFGSQRERLVMYTLQCFYIVVIKTVRAGIPMMTPLIARDLHFSEAESAFVLSGFFQGYTLTQVPAAPIVQKWGPKNVLSFSMLGTAALFVVAPAVAAAASTSARKATSLMALFGMMGLVQGALAPALSQAHQLTPLFAALVTPRLAVRGWRLTCYSFAGVTAVATIVWQLFASNAPKKTNPRVTGSSRKAIHSQPKKAVEWRIFRLPEVQCLIANWVSFGLLNYSMLNLGPTFYMGKLDCTPLQWGAQLSIVNATSIPFGFLSGVVESLLIAKGVPQLTIRRFSTVGGAVGMGICSMLYGLSQSVFQATGFYVLYMLFLQSINAGIVPNMYELGGEDSAMMNSSANALCQIPGFLCAPLELLLRRYTGSWATIYALGSGSYLLTSILYARLLTQKSARELLEERNSA